MMKRVRFGRTELQMPVITCGGMRFQHKWEDQKWEDIPKAGQDNLERTISRAWELGVNHFETARGYGSSEMQLGAILPHFPRGEMILQTKVAPEPDPAKFRANFDKSMTYLKQDYVDLLGLHGINNEEVLEYALRPGGCLEEARKLQREGRVRFIGFSTHAMPGTILKAINSGEFDYVNLHWYFVNELNWPAIEAATKQDMGVFIISPNDKGGKLYAPSEKLSRLCAPLHPMHFNDLYCWARPEVHTLSMGVSSPTDFDIHIQALEDYDRASEIVAPIEKRLRDEVSRMLGADWAEGWFNRIPEYDTIPGEVHVKEILRLWNWAKALDMTEFGKMRYNLLGNAGHWFPGEKAIDFEDSAMLESLKGSPFADRIPSILKEAHQMLADKEVKRLSQSDA